MQGRKNREEYKVDLDTLLKPEGGKRSSDEEISSDDEFGIGEVKHAFDSSKELKTIPEYDEFDSSKKLKTIPECDEVYQLIQQEEIEEAIKVIEKSENQEAVLYYGSFEYNKALLKAGAKADLPNNQGNTPIHIATEKGFVGVVQALLEAGVNKDLPNNQGNTPLHIAANHGSFECIKALLGAGAKPDLPNNQGNTPLHIAANHDRFKCIEALLGAGANADLPNKNGQKAIDLIESAMKITKRKNFGIQSLLREQSSSRLRASDSATGKTYVDRITQPDSQGQVI